jgi:hypothetical protein
VLFAVIVGLVIIGAENSGSSESLAHHNAAASVSASATSVASPASPSSPVAVAESSPANSSSSTETVEYIAEGTGPAESIDYSTDIDGQYGQEQATHAALPWSRTITVPKHEWLNFNSFTRSAQNVETSDSIRTIIKVNDKIVYDHTSTGEYAVVTANASGKQRYPLP